MNKLSPKQYIQTKARSLPVYKCFVNPDWEQAKLANIVVMRRHVNGNITAGFYLVDLLCLGVKDTLFFFNETEPEIEERLGGNLDKMFVAADYDLVHNIVYAGHDFAMDFEIKPHAEFATTKFILEEDDDAVQLIDVEVGDEGMPHLIVHQAGQFNDALLKLKKHAGEGNYLYTIGDHFDDADDESDEDEEFDEEEEDEEEFDEDGDEEEFGDENEDAIYNLEEFDLGDITPLQARYIDEDDLFDEEKVNERAINEVLTLQTEASLRILNKINPGLFEPSETEIDIEEVEKFASGVNEEQENDFKAMQEELVVFYESFLEKTEEQQATEKVSFSMELLKRYPGNPLVVINIFENTFFSEEKQLTETAMGYLQSLSPQYPSATLTLAFAALLNKENESVYQFIYNSNSIAEAFPNSSDLGDVDINIYALLQVLVRLRDDDLKYAIYYYNLSAELEVFSWLQPFVQSELAAAMTAEIDANLPKDEGPGLRIV